ncbi:proton-dependent oligopeptide transporter, POT family [Filimonas lacunae]|uniref:Proton-dependent oligopeptide transporter, POT family n=1 Tax=Filimonas lacunae TaxID=477680 RepID=A0A173MNN3_9BACT|nr:peptide MFS transporter [Filimonas lacunae]BAV09275.1 di-/tripeptide transporter [Filimonas lacunae]SIS70281.1 proton-dependent oligopeptide transporter, POT family [Filimonas lacunae]
MQTKTNQLLGHPRGLFILFFTEMWERFSFYGMKALLIFYLTKYHFFSDTAGNQIVGNYATLVYALPILGGLIADKYLGYRKAVTFGAILLVLGHLGMAMEGTQAYYNAAGQLVQDKQAIQAFYFSMGLIIMGVGFLKPNISAITGRLYEKGDARRDAGFTIFYMGINLGSFSSTLVCGWLGETYGWRYGFGVAGIGMLLGLITFIWGKKHLENKAEPANPALLREKTFAGISKEWMVYLCSATGVFVCWQLVQYHAVVGGLLATTALVVVLFLLWFIIRQCNAQEKGQMASLLVLILFSVIFWALFEQSYSSMNLFTDRVVNRHTAWGEIKASQFLSLSGFFIVLLAPLFAVIWMWLIKKKREPNAAIKFGMGIIFAGTGFGALVLGIHYASHAGQVGPLWLVAAYFLHTCGELCISPVGLSAVTRLAVPKIVGFMLGTWFLATAGSEFIASILANIASVNTTGGIATDIHGSLLAYSALFRFLFFTGLIAGTALLLLSFFIRKYLREQ